MKTQTSPSLFSVLTLAAALILAANKVPAQSSSSATASASQTAPLLSYGVTEILQLSRAKVGDDTIVNFIRNSGSGYGLDASQIIYLKQQGVSDPVINVMLSQPRPATAATPPAAATASSTATATVNLITPPVAPVFQVDPIYVSSSSVYVIPDTQTYLYNAHTYQPYYGGRYWLGIRAYPHYYGRYYSFGVGFNSGRWSGGNYRGGWHR